MTLSPKCIITTDQSLQEKQLSLSLSDKNSSSHHVEKQAALIKLFIGSNVKETFSLQT